MQKIRAQTFKKKKIISDPRLFLNNANTRNMKGITRNIAAMKIPKHQTKKSADKAVFMPFIEACYNKAQHLLLGLTSYPKESFLALLKPSLARRKAAGKSLSLRNTQLG